jgi:hypothetical protein
MDEFYVATEDETPVTIVFPAGSVYTGKFHMAQWTRTHYFGTLLTLKEINKRLADEYLINMSLLPEDYEWAINPETCEPFTPHIHEYWVGETEDWGFFANKPEDATRKAVRIRLYFKESELYGSDCITCNSSADCTTNHMDGWDYESKIIELLELNDGD